MDLTVLSLDSLAPRPASALYLTPEGLADTSTAFPPMENTRFLSAARGEIPDSTPVWVMRQAGRYLEEFRKMRESYNFFQICTTPHLAAEITLQPIRRFDLDASIIFRNGHDGLLKSCPETRTATVRSRPMLRHRQSRPLGELGSPPKSII